MIAVRQSVDDLRCGDFDELQRQLSANTKLVETIKSEVSQRDWAQREWTNLRRSKLEALLEKMHECEEYLARWRDLALEGKAGPPESDYFNELEAVATLYFPELKSEVDAFVFTCKKERMLIVQLARAVLNAQGNETEAVAKSFMSQWNVKELAFARNALTAAARTLLKRIMNVDEGT